MTDVIPFSFMSMAYDDTGQIIGRFIGTILGRTGVHLYPRCYWAKGDSFQHFWIGPK